MPGWLIPMSLENIDGVIRNLSHVEWLTRIPRNNSRVRVLRTGQCMAGTCIFQGTTSDSGWRSAWNSRNDRSHSLEKCRKQNFRGLSAQAIHTPNENSKVQPPVSKGFQDVCNTSRTRTQNRTQHLIKNMLRIPWHPRLTRMPRRFTTSQCFYKSMRTNKRIPRTNLLLTVKLWRDEP